jgi:hypothetical protein
MAGWLGVTAAGAVATVAPVAGSGAAGAEPAITVRVAEGADEAVVELRGVSGTSVLDPGWALPAAAVAAVAGAAAAADGAGEAVSVAAGAESVAAGAAADAGCVSAAGAGSAALADCSAAAGCSVAGAAAAGAGSAAVAGCSVAGAASVVAGAWSVAGAVSVVAAGAESVGAAAWSVAGVVSVVAAGCSAAGADWLAAVSDAGVESVPAVDAFEPLDGALSPLDGASLAGAGALDAVSVLWLVAPDDGLVVDVAGAAGGSPASACCSACALSWSRPVVAAAAAGAALSVDDESDEVGSALELVGCCESPFGLNASASSLLMQATIWSSVIFEKSGCASSQLTGAPPLPVAMSSLVVPDPTSTDACRPAGVGWRSGIGETGLAGPTPASSTGACAKGSLGRLCPDGLKPHMSSTSGSGRRSPVAGPTRRAAARRRC